MPIHSMNYFLHLPVALNISYSLLSTGELRDGITKQQSTYIWRAIWFHQAVNAKESRLCAQPWPTQYRVSSDFLILNFGSFRIICLISMTFQGCEHIFQCQKRLFRENEHKCWAKKASKIVMQWCNLILTWWFWATKVCLRAGKISKICVSLPNWVNNFLKSKFWKLS